MADVTKGVSEQEIVDMYMGGKNYYEIASEVYGFESEDAIAKVRALLEKAEADGKFVGKEEKAK
jgi:hypothetical protein